MTAVANGHTKSVDGNNGSILESNCKQRHKNSNGKRSPIRTTPSYKQPIASKGRKIAECLLGLSIPFWWTFSFQANEPSCRIAFLIASTTAIYGISYALLRHYNEFLQPPLSSWLVDNPNSGGNNEGDDVDCNNKAALVAAEWRSRLLAIANALILIVGSGLCFTEWISTYVPESEGWVKTLPLQCNITSNICSCFSSHPNTYASLFVGYLQWDLCWLIWHRDTHYDIGSMIHHSIFIGVTQFVLTETYFRKPFAWLSLTELSTPFFARSVDKGGDGKKGRSIVLLDIPGICYYVPIDANGRIRPGPGRCLVES